MRTFTLDRDPILGAVALRAIDLVERVTRPFHYRGFFKLSRWCGRLAPADQRCTVELEPDVRFVFLTRDPYWNRLVSSRFHYEEDIGRVLHHMADVDYWFIDAGANYGYWSSLVTSQAYGAKSAIAIEPVTKTYRVLQENCALNGDRFSTLQRAVAAEPGQRVTMEYPRGSVGATAGASMIQREGASDEMERETVESTSIDVMLEQFVPTEHPIVLKLDVEGMEVPALRGATALSQRDWLLVYEDHGSDVACQATEFVMTLDASLFLVTRAGDVRTVESLDEIRRVKTRSRTGYNFFAASRGGLFEARMAEVASDDRRTLKSRPLAPWP